MSQNVYQAEDAVIDRGIIESEHAGYTGSGYVNGTNVVGAWVEWEVSMVDSGQQTLTVFYANGSSEDRPMEVKVNDVVVDEALSFPGSGDWTAWSSKSLSITLNKDSNFIRLTAITGNGGPNLDKIEVTGETNFQLSLDLFGRGTFILEPDQEYYAPGSPVSVTAQAGECFTFQGWKGDLQSGDSAVVVTMDSLVSLQAVFLRKGVYASTEEQLGWSTTHGGTTGGSGGTEVTVTSQSQLENYLGSSSNYIIYIEGTIEITPFGHELPVGSNTTLIGKGSDATLKGGGLGIGGVSNVIVKNLYFRDAFVDFDGKTTDNDAIEINNSTNVWINHCDFSRYDDGLIDIKNAADYVTVSWCRFHNHNKVMLIGADDNDTQDIGHLNVTVHHNWFDGEGGIGLHQRVPRVRFGKVHVFNNFYNKMVIRGPMAAWEADLLLENNYFKDCKDPHPVEGNASDSKLRASGNIYDNSSGRKDQKNTSAVFDASSYYAYTLHETGDVPALVMAGAGVNAPGEIGDPDAEQCYPTGTREIPVNRVHIAEVRLEQNHPNPFRESTVIRYALGQTSWIRIEIYNARGSRVSTPVNRIGTAGEHSIEFIAGGLRPGIYTCRLISPRRVVTRQMVLIR